MRKFIRSFFIAFVSIMLAFLVAIIVMVSVAGAAIESFADDELPYLLQDNTILHIKLQGEQRDYNVGNPLAELLGNVAIESPSLWDIKSAMMLSISEPRIKAIYIECGDWQAGQATIEELCHAIRTLRAHGKPVIAYAENYSQSAYLVASAATQVVLNPVGAVDLHGMGGDRAYMSELFERIGVEMQIFRVGEYKTAVEPYLLRQMSDASRAQQRQLYEGQWHRYLATLSDNRPQLALDLDGTMQQTIVPLQSAEWALQHRLVDTLLYQSDVSSMFSLIGGDDALLTMDPDDRGGDEYDPNESVQEDAIASVDECPESDAPHYATPSQLLSAHRPTAEGEHIALLFAEGEIADRPIDWLAPERIIDKRIIKEIDDLRRDDQVCAVVLRLNSPGGSAFLSDQIWAALQRLRASKPLVVHMGDVAASGGYYMAVAADSIYAMPSTITGSIGIFGMVPNFSPLIGKTGLAFDGYKTHASADLFSPIRPMTNAEKLQMQRNIERGYRLFVRRCADGRRLTPEAIDAVAQGRVWSGGEAQRVSLVDGTLMLDDAIVKARDLYYTRQSIDADILAQPHSHKDLPVVTYPQPMTLYDLMSDDQFASNFTQVYRTLNTPTLMRTVQQLFEHDPLQTRLPYEIQTKY